MELEDCLLTPSAKHTIESLEKHSYKIGTVIPDKEKGHDHVFDALSYCIAYLYPIRRPCTSSLLLRVGVPKSAFNRHFKPNIQSQTNKYTRYHTTRTNLKETYTWMLLKQ